MNNLAYMNNIEYMNVLSKINQNYKQRNTNYILGGVLILSSIGLLYLISKNEIAVTNINSLKQDKEALNFQLHEKEQHLHKLNNSIQNLVNENEFLQVSLAERIKRDLTKNESKDIQIIS